MTCVVLHGWAANQMAGSAEEASAEEYEERLSRYDVAKDPGDHKRLASWCKRSYPKLDHFLQESVTFPKFLPFFDEHTNDIEPDFDIIRAAAKKWLK